MKRMIAGIAALTMAFSMTAFAADAAETADAQAAAESAVTHEDHSEIENALNLQNMNAEWTYNESSDAWILSVVTAVTNPEIENQQGVSVCVPGAYVKGIDTDGDGEADETSGTVNGNLVIDYEAQITSSNGQIYTAATAPIILNTGAAGYGSSNNTKASTSYAAEGYINAACGNRGKQDTATDVDGNTYYTGDAPCCLVDQKNAARFIKYNILLGNIPGNVDYLVSTGGSGGAAHASMFAATSNNPDFYDYEIEAGAVGVYKNEDGSYDTCVLIDGEYVELSDGAWGCIAYSAITSLAEADLTMAFEYYLDSTYEFSNAFQKQLAEYLAAEYMVYINDQNLTVEEAAVGFDLDGDGELASTIALTIEYDEEKYAETRGYGGTYLDLYVAEFQSNLQWYLDNLDYAEDWTWFNAEGTALTDSEVAAMTSEDKALAFLEGRYAKSSSGSGGGPGGNSGGGPGGSEGGESGGEEAGGSEGGESEGESAEGESEGGQEAAEAADEAAEAADETAEAADDTERSFENSDVAVNSTGDTMDVGTPEAGTTQASGSSTICKNYSTYDEMVAAYKEDIEAVEAGDRFGNNQVELYDPLNYIGAEGTENPTWARIVMGASEGDISMLASLNMEILFLNAGTDAIIEWQWDGGHVPSETLGNSFALCVDTMYGKHVEGAVQIEKAAAETQMTNGTSESASGKDLTSWVDSSDLSAVTFSVAGAAAYRTSGASKAIPGFDVIDYGQEDYVFGSAEKDARHWDKYVLQAFEEHADTLSALFN